MTVRQALELAFKLLRHKSSDSPNLDAEVLLMSVLKRSRAWLFAHSEKSIRRATFKKFKTLVCRRAKHEPIAYITGKKEFYDREFFVNKNVLIPRPETETLVEATLKCIREASTSSRVVPHLRASWGRRGDLVTDLKTAVIDVGTGSGCIAVTLAKELEKLNLKNIKIFAADSSASALAVTRRNARKHRVKITFVSGNLLDHCIPMVPRFEPWDHRNLVVVANLPYLTTAEWHKTQPEIRVYEPRSALVGGRNGLKYYRKLLKQLYRSYWTYKSYRTYSFTCFFEINPWQKKPLAQMTKKIFPAARIEFIKDLGGSVRVCKIELKLLGEEA